MTVQEIAMHLWPCWLLGIVMLLCVYFSEHRDLLRVSLAGMLRFARSMALITAFRILVFKFLANGSMVDQVHSVSHMIPWQATLGVFWEDAVHVLPLVLLGRYFADKKWYNSLSLLLMICVMISFGSGHLYQGPLAAIGLSFYIPFSKKIGKKYGFGTVMLCHILYDMITLLSLSWMVGG